MQVGVIGINHKSAELQFRELFAKVCQKRFGPQSLHPDLFYVLLSTCNRTEIYFSAEDLAEAQTYFLRSLKLDIQEDFEHKPYTYFGSECFIHLARVTAGMDSAILFETEIQGQVKQAYESAACQRELKSALHFMFQKCLKIGKEIRSKFPRTQTTSSLEKTIFNLSKQYLSHLAEKKVLFVGASEINYKIYNYLKQNKDLKISFCNRSLQRLKRLGIQSFEILLWEKRHFWTNYDLVLFATKAPDYLVHSAPELNSRKLIIDLSVPRNVNPQLANHAHIILFNIDQLLIHQNPSFKATELASIEKKYLIESVYKQILNFVQREESRHLWLSKAVS